MPRGRKPGPGTPEERAAARRERVRLNVRAFRLRKQGITENAEAKSNNTLKWVENNKWQQQVQLHSPVDQQSPDDASDSYTFVSEKPSSQATGSDDESSETLVVQHKWSPGSSMLVVPNESSTYATQLYTLLADRFLPKRLALPSSDVDDHSIRTPCALWITTALDLAHNQSNSGLTDVLLSITLAMVAQERSRDDLLVECHRMYSRSLAKTRIGLQRIIDDNKKLSSSDIQSLFLACHAASIFELMVNGSLADMTRHVNGIGFMIEQQQNHSEFPTLVGERLLEEYRMLEMAFCIMHRTLSVSNRMKATKKGKTKNQKSVSRRRGASIFSDVLDLANEIPPFMVKLDVLQAQSTRPDFSPQPVYNVAELTDIIRQLLAIHSRVSSWSLYMRLQATSSRTDPESFDEEMQAPVIDMAQLKRFEFVCHWLFCLSYEVAALQTAIQALEMLATRNPSPIGIANSIGVNAPGEKEDMVLLKDMVSSRTLRRDLIQTTSKILQLMPYMFSDESGFIGRSIGVWPLEPAWASLESEWMKLSKEEMDIATLSSPIDEEKNFIAENKQQVARQLKLCKDAAKQAKSWGLPLWYDR